MVSSKQLDKASAALNISIQVSGLIWAFITAISGYNAIFSSPESAAYYLNLVQMTTSSLLLSKTSVDIHKRDTKRIQKNNLIVVTTDSIMLLLQIGFFAATTRRLLLRTNKLARVRKTLADEASSISRNQTPLSRLPRNQIPLSRSPRNQTPLSTSLSHSINSLSSDISSDEESERLSLLGGRSSINQHGGIRTTSPQQHGNIEMEMAALSRPRLENERSLSRESILPEQNLLRYQSFEGADTEIRLSHKLNELRTLYAIQADNIEDAFTCIIDGYDTNNILREMFAECLHPYTNMFANAIQCMVDSAELSRTYMTNLNECLQEIYSIPDLRYLYSILVE